MSFLLNKATASMPIFVLMALSLFSIVVGRCATRDPTPAELERVENEIQEYRASRQSSTARSSFLVEVVVHIIHDGPNGQVSDQVVKSQMDHLNDAFSGTGFSFNLVDTVRTDNGRWYEDCRETDNEWQPALRKNSHGPNVMYLYVCDLRGDLGYATLPFGFSLERDGVVCDTETLPGMRDWRYGEGDTAVHEAGHWLGLHHTFKDGCSGSGDSVSDTPAVETPNSSCATPVDSCPSDGLGPDDTRNYMDYVDDECMDQFTPGQVERMRDMWEIYRGTGGGETGSGDEGVGADSVNLIQLFFELFQRALEFFLSLFGIE